MSQENVQTITRLYDEFLARPERVVWTLRGGRIVAWHVYMDPTQALEAVGLSE